MTPFERCLAHTLGIEKGVSDHPRDPGGLTNFGWTQELLERVRTLYAQFKNYPASVIDLTVDHAALLYEIVFWNENKCGEFPLPLALPYFDAMVNSKVSKVRVWLQKALKVTPDGWIGPGTIEAARKLTPYELREAITEFHALRAFNYMLQDDIDDDFGLGWARRLMKTHNVAMTLIGGSQ